MLLSMHITFEHYQSRTSRRIDLLHDLGVGFTACLLFARAGEACGPHATHATQAYQGKQREGNDPIQRERGPQAQANDTNRIHRAPKIFALQLARLLLLQQL